MINTKLISSLLKDNSLRLGQHIELRPGQILKGTILKLFSENMALVQLGGLKLTAQLTVNLQAGDKVWLQVHPSGDPVTLKVLEQNQLDERNNPSSVNVSNLALSLGVPDSKATAHVLTRFIKEQLPIEKAIVEQAAKWIEETGAGPEGMDPLLIAVNKGLPVRGDVLTALKQVLFGPNLTKLGKELKEELNLLQKTSHISLDIIQQVDELTNLVDSILSFDSQYPDTSSGKLKEQLKSLGLMWERQLHNSTTPPDESNLKTMLYLLEEKLTKAPEGSALIHKLDVLMSHLKGQQLLLAPTQSPIEQLLIQIPFPFLGDKLPFVQLEAKKQVKGDLDADHCRLLFFLHLTTLGETLLHVTVSNRVVSVQILGNHPELEARAKSFHKDLLEGLKKEGYHLSLFKIGEMKSKPGNSKTGWGLFENRKGMDIRI
jgi:hypothetical protein